MDELHNLPEPSRSRAKALLTCTICTKYFVDPRVLPCRHSFCRKCLQATCDKLQAAAKPRHVGAMACPKCSQPIGIPAAGPSGFPVDAKIGRIKELVINEMAKNISKTMKPSATGPAKLESSPKAKVSSDAKAKAPDASAAAASGTSQHRRDRSYDSMSGSYGEDAYGGLYKRSSAHPDFAKFARFFDHEGNPAESTPFKPTIRADRHRVGYSKSMVDRHPRRRVIVRAPSDADSRSDRYGSAPHMGRDTLSEQSDDLSEDEVSNLQRSRSARPTTRRYHSKIDEDEEDDDLNGGDPRADKTDDAFARNSTSDQNRTTRNENVLPNLRRSQATSDADDARKTKVIPDFSNGNATSANGHREKSRAEEIKSRRTTASEGVRVGREPIIRKKSASGTLPVHHENIVTGTPKLQRQSSKPDNVEQNANGTHTKQSSNTQSTSEAGGSSAGGRQLPKTPAASASSSDKSGEQNPDASGRRAARGQYPRSGFKKTDSTEKPEPTKRPEKPATEQNKKSSSEKRAFTERPKTTSSVRTKTNSVFEPAAPESRSSYTTTRRPDVPVSNISDEPKPSEERSRGGEGNLNSSAPEEREPGQTKHRRRDNKPRTKQEYGINNENANCAAPAAGNGHYPMAAGNDNSYPRRTKEQRRMDARRRFSQRVHDAMNKYFTHQDRVRAEANARAEAESELQNGGANGSAPSGHDVGVGPPPAGVSAQTQNGNLTSERCNAGVPDATQCNRRTKSQLNNINNNNNQLKDAKLQTGVQVPKPPEKVRHLEDPLKNWDALMRGTRAKYSAERTPSSTPTSTPVKKTPTYADGVVSKWRVEKSEFGIPTSMAITSKGCVVVAEYGRSCVEFYNETGALAHKMDGLKPFSVVVNDRDQVFVGDRKSRAVRIFDDIGCDVAHWDATTFNWICGIGILPNEQLAVYDRERCKIGVYSSPGEKIREFASFGVSNAQLCMADFIAVDGKGRVLVADSGNHCVKVFDAATGAFLTKFGARGVRDGCLDWPKGICVDADDNVIVTDVYCDRVSMFTSSGQFLRHLITDVTCPYSVCYGGRASNTIGVTSYSLDGASLYEIFSI